MSEVFRHLPGAVAAAVVAALPLASHAASAAPVTTTTSASQQQSQQGLLDQDKLVTSSLHHALLGRTTPYIYAVPGSIGPTLLLPASATPYDLSTLARNYPAAFEPGPGGSTILEIPLEVGPGATLVISSSTVPTLYLRSTHVGYAHITAVQGSLLFEGTATQPLRISSIDPATGHPDSSTADGRAYVATEGGVMRLQHVAASDLGFLTGISSGVSWIPYGGTQPSGGTSESSFRRNYFGVYASHARAFTASNDVFAGNVLYGLDLHDRTDAAVISHSTAINNGSHGFILNRGCLADRFVATRSAGNGGAGYLINSNHVENGQAQYPSSETLLSGVTASDNFGAGILIHGGHGNSVVDSTISGNEAGVLVVGRATGSTLHHNTVTASAGTAIEVAAGSSGAAITANHVEGAATGIFSNQATPTTIAGNVVTSILGTGIKLVGPVADMHLSGNKVSGTGAAPIFLNSEPQASIQGATVVAWTVPGPNRWIRPLELLLWGLILVPPLALFLWGRRRKRSKLANYQESA